MSDSTKTVYTREEGNRWLAWLARGMERHNEQVLMIENLQPSWLESFPSRLAYIFISRAGATLFFLTGLVLIWIGFRRFTKVLPEPHVLSALLFGLGGGVFMAIVDTVKSSLPKRDRRRWPSWVRILTDVVLGLGFFALLGALADIPSGDVAKFGIFLTGIWALRSTQPNLHHDIRLLEEFPISFAQATKELKRIRIHLALVIILALVIGQLFLGRGELPHTVVTILATLAMMATTVAVLYAVLRSTQFVLSTKKSRPNEGVWLTLKRAGQGGAIAGVVGAVGVFCTIGVFNWTDPKVMDFAVKAALAWFGYVGLFFLSWFGGLDFLRHWVLRGVLVASKRIPAKLSTFLDFCSDRLHFLQKTGGSYLFAHRYLLQHFARMSSDTTEK